MIAGSLIEFVHISWPLKAIHRFIILKETILSTRKTEKNAPEIVHPTVFDTKNSRIENSTPRAKLF